MPINITKVPHYKGLCYAAPCAWDIGTRWSNENPVVPEGFYGSFLSSTDFSLWSINYDGNSYTIGDFTTFFQSVGGDYLEGISGAVGLQSYFYIRIPSLTGNLEVLDESGSKIIDITTADLDFNAPSLCYQSTIAAPSTFDSAMIAFDNSGVMNDYGYIDIPGISAFYADPNFIIEMEAFIQAFFGSAISTVTVEITTEIVVTFKNVYHFPSVMIDLGQTPSTINTNNIICP